MAALHPDLMPRGLFEAAMSLGSVLPSWPGWVCYRKLKRRIAQRSKGTFIAHLAQVGPGDIVIDLGANVGRYTRLMAETGAEVHAFEPDPDTVIRLRAALGENTGVTIHQAAVSNCEGTARFARPRGYADAPESASKASSIMRSDARMDLAEAFEVPLVDFAAFVMGLPGRVALVKMDIEGAEWDVLDHLFATGAVDRIDAIFVETHERLDRADLPRAKALQGRARRTASPYLNLYWR